MSDMYKQSIVIRSDLNMGRGKLCAQSSHASLATYLLVARDDPSLAKEWVSEGMKKIVLKVSSESELMEYFKKCKSEGIPCELIRDAGHTQVEAGSVTCFGAGPWEEEELDKVLGKLKLL